MLFCLAAGGGLVEWLLTAKADTVQSLNNLVIDDFNRLEDRKSGLIWASIADQTKDYRRVGTKQFVQSNGRSCLNIKELINTKKNLIIVGTKAAPDNPSDLNFAGYDGIYLRAKGTGGPWTLGLWIESKKAGTQLYQAPFELKNRWQEFRLPFRMFYSMPTSKTLNSREIFRIVTMPALQQRAVEIFLDEIGFYKEQKNV